MRKNDAQPGTECGERKDPQEAKQGSASPGSVNPGSANPGVAPPAPLPNLFKQGKHSRLGLSDRGGAVLRRENLVFNRVCRRCERSDHGTCRQERLVSCMRS